MNNSNIYYNSRGYEATFDGEANRWIAVARGYVAPNGTFVKRGGPEHPSDKPIAKFTLDPIWSLCGYGRSVIPLPDLPLSVHETFHDALLANRDLLGNVMFRNKPDDDAERRLFAAAYDAAQKIRASVSVLNVNQMFFMLNPPIFFFADCFARDKSGAFWLMFCVPQELDLSNAIIQTMFGLTSYVLEAGEYVPANETVRLGAWKIAPTGCRFVEVPNDRIAARDAVISSLQEPPF